VGIQPKKPTVKGPAEWFTGDVWIDSIVQPTDHSTLNVGAVHFTPGARTAWHSHDGGQTLYVTEGRGRVQSRGEGIIELRPGDVHLTPDGEQHWHGAHHQHFMTHISITHGPATWGDHVTDAEYGPEA
jgi:quercetin dioxygenase-like cupin family protein